MSLWSKIKNVLGFGSRETVREPVERRVARENPSVYIDRLTALKSEQEQIRAVEAVMFNPRKSLDDRKAALEKYTDITGWYRPDNARDWSSEEWKRWEEIYESEPEVF